MRANETHAILDALDTAAEALEGESERTEKEGFPDEAEQERIKAAHYREVKRKIVVEELVIVPAGEFK